MSSLNRKVLAIGVPLVVLLVAFFSPAIAASCWENQGSHPCSEVLCDCINAGDIYDCNNYFNTWKCTAPGVSAYVFGNVSSTGFEQGPFSNNGCGTMTYWSPGCYWDEGTCYCSDPYGGSGMWVPSQMACPAGTVTTCN